ncbi:MAG: acetyl-CoA carboxylase biotin carboxylase subunit [Phycisphaerales bacterium]|nr:acetyl-CoA carboxylase biotin carboxylase subunit [Phycisphaerales bacterium]
MFKRILIANRGEIALRVIRACRELGVSPVCVYSVADRDGPWIEQADEAVCIGPAASKESYLRIERLIAAAEVTGADAIHPGYGFLSENASFAEVCRDCNIAFIGPSPEAMNLLGDKVNCKRLARQSGTPVFPGTEGGIEDIDEAAKVANEIGYPVIIKASAGGGGRGMRVARSEAELRENVEKARQEALAAFGNGTVYVEKYLENARHFEVQTIGDNHGNAVHLFERDCSSQRRHQKLVEEAPSPGVDPAKRMKVCESAAALIRRANYCGVATVEFLMDKKQDFYMLEVNTRVQVEHPVTEMITGVDIVQTQIRVAAGEPLPMQQQDIKVNGHAIEVRINAEDPDKNFMPQAGLIETFVAPGGPGVRLDSHARAGYRIPPNYDSMIGKLIVHGPTRAAAIARMRQALNEFKIGPLRTTIALHKRIMDNTEFQNADIDIHWVERWLKSKDTSSLNA